MIFTFDFKLPFGWYKWVLSGSVPPVVVNLQIFVGQCRIRYLQRALESAYFVLELLTIRNSHQPKVKKISYKLSHEQHMIP